MGKVKVIGTGKFMLNSYTYFALFLILLTGLQGCERLLDPYIDREPIPHGKPAPDWEARRQGAYTGLERYPVREEPAQQRERERYQVQENHEGYENGYPAERDNPEAVPTVGSKEPAAVLALLDSADQQKKQGSFESAAASIERALRINPRSPKAYAALAAIRLDQKRYLDVEPLAKKGLLYLAQSRDPRGTTAVKNRFWELIALAREGLKDRQGAEQARQNIR